MSKPWDAVRRWWADEPMNSHANGGHANGKMHDRSDRLEQMGLSSPKKETKVSWLEILERENIPRKLNYPSTTLGQLLDQTAGRFGANPAIIYSHTKWDYRELLARVNRAAAGLARLGVRKNERVILTLPNCPEMVICFYAIQKLGAVAVNIGPLMGSDDVRQVIQMTAARVGIGLDLQMPMLTHAGEHSTIAHWVEVSLQGYQTVLKKLGYQLKLWQGRSQSHAAIAPAHSSFEDLMNCPAARPPTVVSDIDEVAVLQATGGTTGGVKLAQLSHRNLLSNALQVAMWEKANWGQERVLAVLPMFHVYGLCLNLINPVLIGAAIILETRFAVDECMELLDTHRPTIFPLVPAICDAISNQIEKTDHAHALPGLRLCISGAAPLTKEVAERFESLTGAKVIEGFGLTEASPVTHSNLPGQSRYGTIGLPFPDTDCRVVDIEDPTKDVPHGEQGELLVSGPQVFRGYLANPEQTDLVLWTDTAGKTWLRTGDVMWVDDEGFYHVVDRKKDMIIHSGLKIYPIKVERVLKTYPGVIDAAVVGKEHAIHTENVVAYVVMKDSTESEAQLTDNIRAFCRKHLAPYEVPAEVHRIDAIPRSPLGKVLKKELRTRRHDSPATDVANGESVATDSPAPEVIVINPDDPTKPSNGPSRGPDTPTEKEVA